MQGTISPADKTMVGSTNELQDKGRHYHVFQIKRPMVGIGKDPRTNLAYIRNRLDSRAS